ncbi:MAG: TonB-dependent receptor [SAR324 cluster bacterium]|nr:TonB-dependent receptor [SAR324 cluster bacterium]
MAVPLLCLAGAAPAFSQQSEPAGEEASPVPAQGGPREETEEVIITATRIETATSQVGSTVTVITAEQLEEKQQRFVLDALREVPGVDIRRSGGPGSQTSIFMRGTDSDHTLLMIDGIQVHDVSSPTGAPVLDLISTGNVARIEVLRGPQSTLYGSDAIGGVINIISKKGKGPPKFSATLEGGSFGTVIERVDFSGGGEEFNYSVNASNFSSDGFSARSNDNEDDSYRNRTIAGRFGVEPSESFGVDFFFRAINADVAIDSGGDPSRSETKLTQTMLKAEPRLLLLDGVWEQKLSVWMHETERDTQGTGFVLPSNFIGTISGIDWQHNLYIHDSNTITLGAELEKQEARSRVSGFPEVDVETSNTALYLQDQFQFGKSFSGTIGLRQDRHEDFGEAVTYRAAAAFRPGGAGTLLRGSAGTGFKAPSLLELFDSTFGSNNPNLEPEKSTGYDFGIEQSWLKRKLHIGLTYFRNDIENMIVAVFNGSAFQNINIEQVRTEGLESFVTVKPDKRLRTRLRFTITETEARKAASFGITEGSQLLRRPRKTASADLTYRGKNRQVTTSVLYIGKRKDIDPATFATVTAESYTVVNVAASYKPNSTVEVFARLDNVFDEDYEEVLGFNTPGASAFGGLTINF